MKAKLSMCLRGWIVTIARGRAVFRQGTAWNTRYYTATGARMNRTTAYQLDDLELVRWGPTDAPDVWRAELTPKALEAIGLVPEYSGCHPSDGKLT